MTVITTEDMLLVFNQYRYDVKHNRGHASSVDEPPHIVLLSYTYKKVTHTLHIYLPI